MTIPLIMRQIIVRFSTYAVYVLNLIGIDLSYPFYPCPRDTGTCNFQSHKVNQHHATMACLQACLGLANHIGEAESILG